MVLLSTGCSAGSNIVPVINCYVPLYLYRRETEFFTVFREEQGMVPRHIFEEFIAFAHDSDLEDVLTLQTKLYRCAHIFLGNIVNAMEIYLCIIILYFNLIFIIF